MENFGLLLTMDPPRVDLYNFIMDSSPDLKIRREYSWATQFPVDGTITDTPGSIVYVRNEGVWTINTDMLFVPNAYTSLNSAATYLSFCDLNPSYVDGYACTMYTCPSGLNVWIRMQKINNSTTEIFEDYFED